MTKQAQVGLFALAALLLLFGMFYILTDFGHQHNGYRVGIHFDSAAGLQTGAPVYFSGVSAGTIDDIRLLPDGTVEVIAFIRHGIRIPAQSKFLIQAPLTGTPTLLIVPPHPPLPPTTQYLPETVLPIAEQPRGSNPVTVGDLLAEGQGEIRRLDDVLLDIQQREPQLLDSIERTLTNVDRTTRAAQRTVEVLALEAQAVGTTIDSTVSADAPRINALVAHLDAVSRAMDRSSASLSRLATDPRFTGSIIATAQNVAETTKILAAVAGDLRSITGDPQTQAQLRDAIAHLDAAAQRASSILGRLGGRSRVYGVDAGATPPPAAGTPSGGPPPASLPHGRGRPQPLARLTVRETLLSAQRLCCVTPLLSADRGPQTDLGFELLPSDRWSLTVGANDLGHATTWNAFVLRKAAPDLHWGGGLLYSRLGIVGSLGSRDLRLDADLYDPRLPLLDVRGSARLAPGVRAFVGQRAINRSVRRTVYGLEWEVP